MSELATPADEQGVVDAVRAANADRTSLSIEGHGSKTALGRHAPRERTISTRALSGVLFYEPAELVLAARAGAPVAEIAALLDAHGQQLAFEPIDCAILLGGEPGAATLGGMVAVNASGPRRIKAGAARDHLLGFRCVTGRGDVVKSGGRVMKNVTGYDLSKLVAGSYGTLAVLTEVTLKVLPKPETEQTLMVLGRDEQAGLAVLRKASATPYEVSSFAFLPEGACSWGAGVSVAALRLEGPPISVTKRRDDLAAHLAQAGAPFDVLEEGGSRAFWADVRDARPLAAHDGVVWRVSLAPTDGFAFVDALRRAGAPLVAHFYDWVGGLVWLCLETAADAHASVIRARVDGLRGHATLVRARAETRACVDVFHPQPPALAALTQRVKDSFDPAHILERGRLRAEF
ncbi:MAG: glycolate oxidase subunit GlcE [Methylocystis sp.]|nr:glycolate oxidase subunit GlcE [Methylocystis sp.]